MRILIAASIISALSVASADDRHPCPTFTSTTSVCSTCIRPMCMDVSTIMPGCGCPQAVPTVFTGFPCDRGCPGGCAGTEYVTATKMPDCEPAPTEGACV